MDANAIKNTISLCPECYQSVPATVYDRDGKAVMVKTCPEHGTTECIIESDVEFYKRFDHPNNKIFDGFFINITDRCNLNCSYCYHPKGTNDISIDKILDEAAKHDCPIYLTGGEPTLRADLPEIAASIHNRVYMPTNGIGLLDDEYMKALFAVIAEDMGHKGIALSYHAEYPELFNAVMNKIRGNGYRITSVIFTLTDPGQLAKCLSIADEWADHVLCFRVHCATPLWASDSKPIFLSDVIAGFDGELMPEVSKTVWSIGKRNTKLWAFCHWDTIHTIDKNNIACGPYTRCNDGEVRHLTEGFILNGHIG